MILEPILTEALSAGRQDREQSTVHPIVMLPSHRAVEIETRVRGIALSLNRKTGLCAEDLFQEGMLGIVKKFQVGDSVGNIIWHARYGMRDYVRREMNERHAKSEAMKVWHLAKATSRTFEELERCLCELTDHEERVMRLWLDGETRKSIGRILGVDKSTAQRTIELAAAKMAACLGQTLHVEYLWPTINRALPLGVYMKDGKFVARCGAGGRRYLGTFRTCQEAVEARNQAT